MNSLRKEIIAKLTIRLDVPADIKAPDLPPEEVSQLVKERAGRLIKEQTAAIPAFDEKREQAAICKKLKIACSPLSVSKLTANSISIGTFITSWPILRMVLIISAKGNIEYLRMLEKVRTRFPFLAVPSLSLLF